MVAVELFPNILFKADFIDENFLSDAAVRTNCLSFTDKLALSSSLNASTESGYSILYFLQISYLLSYSIMKSLIDIFSSFFSLSKSEDAL